GGGPRRGFAVGLARPEVVRTEARAAAARRLCDPETLLETRARSLGSHLPNLISELLTWGAGNLSAFWAFARGCDRVMHLQFRAGELGVSLVQVRAKRFEDS